MLCLKEQRKKRSFFWSRLLFFFILLCLCIKFYVFEYPILKIIRFLILLIYLFILSWIDYSIRKIPNNIIKQLFWIRTFILIVEICVYREHLGGFCLSFVMGFLWGGGILFLCYFISRGGMGAGDVKLFALLGYYLGSHRILEVIFLSFFFSASVSVILMCLKKIGWKTKIAFAPFVLLGTVVVMGLGK